jgi:hypothetical protein
MLDDLLNPDVNIPIYVKGLTVLLSMYCLYGWLGMARVEITQLRKLKWGYFTDYWNMIDGTSLFVNITFLTMLNSSLLSDTNIFGNHVIRILGGFSCFLLWIKVFYWMRLFKSTAYFVTLIISTIADLKLFTAMCFIILVAYANLLYCIGKNVNDETAGYVAQYTGLPVVDAIIATYFIAMGEFGYDAYNQEGDKWYDKLVIWFIFITGTILLLVVFMNMLIAIMGDTFGAVGAIQEQSSL